MAKAAKKLKRILLVDDDPISIYLTRAYLNDLQIGEFINSAGNGLEALELIKTHCATSADLAENCPDLILLDLNMPLMDGFDFLEQCKQAGYFEKWQSKIVILTSSKASKDLEKAKNYPVNGYLIKPITENELLSVISREFDA